MVIKSNCGFTFLEVLISLFILSIGLLGLAELQIALLRNMQQSYYYSIAQTQLASMIERVYVNQSSFYQTRECEEWNQENQRLLPSGLGKCHCTQKECLITLDWKGHRSSQSIKL